MSQFLPALRVQRLSARLGSELGLPAGHGAWQIFLLWQALARPFIKYVPDSIPGQAPFHHQLRPNATPETRIPRNSLRGGVFKYWASDEIY